MKLAFLLLVFIFAVNRSTQTVFPEYYEPEDTIDTQEPVNSGAQNTSDAQKSSQGPESSMTVSEKEISQERPTNVPHNTMDVETQTKATNSLATTNNMTNVSLALIAMLLAVLANVL